jgi:CcmD family protein
MHSSFEPRARESVSDIAWLAVAFAAVWIGIGAYAVSLVVRQRRLERRVDDLKGSSRTSSD